MLTEGEYPLGHLFMPVTFSAADNYQTDFLCFKVALFDCGYNVIIGRPRLTKFMAIPHYSFMILRMPEPQGIIIVCADFQGATECIRGAVQMALTARPSMAPLVQNNDTPAGDDLTIPTNEAPTATSLRPTEETKRVNLDFFDEHKTAIISSSLIDK
jgi:hypothetical protein